MKMTNIETIKTKEEAQNTAIDWQHWMSEQSLGYSDLIEWSSYFEKLAKKFNLKREFKENGII